ncbi:MAG: sigma-70 family RNA polymerase sigma factor, partial [Spirochaetales bacterium]|nr:sigma-70 family RNA polymerase sigma factor [Spirochaetales bacterium]
TFISMFEDLSYEPSKKIYNKQLRRDRLKTLDVLSEKEKQVLLYRYSFYDGKKYTLKKIGDRFGISPETVRQIEKRAIIKLAKEAEKLKDYVYTE